MSPFEKPEEVEQCRITPAATGSSTRRKCLPLTYFDLIFLHFPPVQRIFFYDLPATKSHVFYAELANLKLSLSLALSRFYPLAGALTFPESGQPPVILCSDSDSVFLTVSKSSDDFHELSGNHARAAARFRHLVPPLPGAAVLSVQVTLFLKGGVAIGTTVHHAAADGSAYTHFMKTWALIAKQGETAALSVLPAPVFDREKLRDIKGLENVFLKDLEDLKNDGSLAAWDLSGRPNLVRATFCISPEEIRRLGRRTTAGCSPYSLACGLVWASLARARAATGLKKERFGFVTGCRPRLRPALPATYFGNCLGICCVEMEREELVRGRGAAAGAEAIWKVIMRLEKGAFDGAEGWVRAVADYSAARSLTVAGSPKLGIYGVDFGWGRPRKVELVSVEKTGAMSLAESREADGGIEVGIALPACEMKKFVDAFVMELGEAE
ncbi:hypothetical protein KSP39_PZI004781 [Platanthera zijinensis]|uniref:Uncharacterized protein n=1 Tax=Platanthera zijinensis TaxID=2320716 RepID=A0AAP0BVU7_9ASPA